MFTWNYGDLLYWITERERVRQKKESGLPKPWSDDKVFQTTYFCNVRREDDRVTRYIRKTYGRWVNHPLFVHNIILARFLNWPDTLHYLDYVDKWDPEYVNQVLNERKLIGKVWGNAYIVSTCGRKMDKIDYLTQIVMPSIAEAGERLDFEHKSCYEMSMGIQSIEGVSTFMAGQVIADLKNTNGHPLRDAPDWWTFVLHGPGSRRGMNWLYDREVSEREWYDRLPEIQAKLKEDGWPLCAQDVQNCLCEFDKYMRVDTGTGRSKRSYDGA